MIEADLKSKVRALNQAFTDNLENELNKILENGCLDLTKYENDFILPKIVFSAMLKNGSLQFAPTGKEFQREIRNVYNFL